MDGPYFAGRIIGKSPEQAALKKVDGIMREPDECAAALRVLARKLLGVDNEAMLNAVRIGTALNWNVTIQADSLGPKAEDLRDLLGDPKKERFPTIGHLIEKINGVARECSLETEVSEAVEAVQVRIRDGQPRR